MPSPTTSSQARSRSKAGPAGKATLPGMDRLLAMPGLAQALLLAMVIALVAGHAAAQRGPAPGGDPLAYAQGHYTGKAGEAAADPAGFATSHATPAAIGNESTTAAYVACWTAHDTTGVQAPGCDLFYTPPGDPGPVRQEQEAANATAALNTTAAVEATQDLANATVDALGDIVEDPTQAPGAVAQVVDAVVAFVGTLVDLVVAAVQGLGLGMVALGRVGLDGLAVSTGALLGLLGGIPAIGSAFSGGLAAGLGSLVDAAGLLGAMAVAVGPALAGFFALAGAAIATGALAVVDALVAGARGLGAGIVAAAQAVAVAGGAVVDGVAAAAGAVVDGVAAAAGAIADAAAAVADAVASLWSDEAAPAPDVQVAVPEAPQVDVDTSLVDGVLEDLT